MRYGISLLMMTMMASGEARSAPAVEFHTHLFPIMDGEADRNGCGGRNPDIEVGYADNRGRRQVVAWITFQVEGLDLSASTRSSLIMIPTKVKEAGTLQVFTLAKSLVKDEDDVTWNDLIFDPKAPLAEIAIKKTDEERMIRLDLGTVFKKGQLHGLALVSKNNLNALSNRGKAAWGLSFASCTLSPPSTG
jgi:hypothetical protein